MFICIEYTVKHVYNDPCLQQSHDLSGPPPQHSFKKNLSRVTTCLMQPESTQNGSHLVNNQLYLSIVTINRS